MPVFSILLATCPILTVLLVLGMWSITNLVHLNDTHKLSYSIRGNHCSIGRHAKRDVRCNDPSVSRYLADIIVHNKTQLVLTPHPASTSFLSVNGILLEKKQTRELKAHDILRFHPSNPRYWFIVSEITCSPHTSLSRQLTSFYDQLYIPQQECLSNPQPQHMMEDENAHILELLNDVEESIQPIHDEQNKCTSCNNASKTPTKPTLHPRRSKRIQSTDAPYENTRFKKNKRNKLSGKKCL